MHAAKRGVVAGIVGGMGMGMWTMLYFWAAGLGFWTPLGYIGHFLVRNPQITDTLQVVVGLAIHMMMSMVLGAILGVILPGVGPALGALRGMVIGIAIWLVMQYVILNVFDPVAFRGLIPWVFAVAHLFYGGMFGLTLALSGRRAGAEMAGEGLRA